MDIVLTTPPDEDEVLNIITLAELKDNEAITHTVHDARLTECINSAYAFLDGRYGWLNRSILPQTWTLWLPKFENEVELPYGPVMSVDSIQYYDANGVLQTLASSEYEVLNGHIVCKVCKAYNVTWPTIDKRNRAVSITYTAGFGLPDDMQFSVKQSLRRALLLLASHFYRNPSWTYAEPRLVAVNRITVGVENLIGFLRVPNTHE